MHKENNYPKTLPKCLNQMANIYILSFALGLSSLAHAQTKTNTPLINPTSESGG